MCHRRILIVDDDKVVLKLLKTFMEDLLPGSQITAVEDGPEALTELREQAFDLILTDYQMPGMNGLDLAWAVQQISSHIPVVLMSAGYGPDEIQPRLGSTPLAGYLAKPFTMLQLREMLLKNGL